MKRMIPFNIELAKQGAKIVTRCGYPVRIGFYDVKNEFYPILALVQDGEYELPYSFTKNGKYHIKENKDSSYDLFIEEDVEKEVEETNDYNPYKETVESISDMVERYANNGDLQDFYDNVKVKCKDAFEYEKTWCKDQDEKSADIFEIKPDKWYVCHSTTCSSESGICRRTWFYNGTSYLGTDILKLDIDVIRDYFHPWDINDTRPGDVLVCIGKYGQEIGIVKKYVGKYGGCDKCFETYCFVDWEGIFRLGEYMGSKEIYPATKEQRDFLFQKMKEEGYEWDEENKELKKVADDSSAKVKEVKNEIKTRRMTHQELAWWLRDHPEEHREYSHEDGRYVQSGYYDYFSDDANVKVYDGILIRRNGGEWQEPLVEE